MENVAKKIEQKESSSENIRDIIGRKILDSSSLLEVTIHLHNLANFDEDLGVYAQDGTPLLVHEARERVVQLQQQIDALSISTLHQEKDSYVEALDVYKAQADHALLTHLRDFPELLQQHLRMVCYEDMANQCFEEEILCLPLVQTPKQLIEAMNIAQNQGMVFGRTEPYVVTRAMNLATRLLRHIYNESPNIDPEEATIQVMESIGFRLSGMHGLGSAFERVVTNSAQALAVMNAPSDYFGFSVIDRDTTSDNLHNMLQKRQSKIHEVTRRQMLESLAAGTAILSTTLAYGTYSEKQKQDEASKAQYREELQNTYDISPEKGEYLESYLDLWYDMIDWMAEKQGDFGGVYHDRSPDEHEAFRAAFLEEFHSKKGEFGTKIDQLLELADELGVLLDVHIMLTNASCHGIPLTYMRATDQLHIYEEALFSEDKSVQYKRYSMRAADYLPTGSEINFGDVNPLHWRLLYSDDEAKEKTHELLNQDDGIELYANAVIQMLDSEEYRAIFQQAPGYTFSDVLSRIKTAVNRFGKDPLPTVEQLQSLIDYDLAQRDVVFLGEKTEKFVYFNDVEDDFQDKDFPGRIADAVGFQGERRFYFDGALQGGDSDAVADTPSAMINELLDNKETTLWLLIHGSPDSLLMSRDGEPQSINMEDTLVAALIGRLITTRDIDTLGKIKIISESCYSHNYMRKVMERVRDRIIGGDYGVPISDEERTFLMECVQAIQDGTLKSPQVRVTSQRNSFGFMPMLPRTLDHTIEGLRKAGFTQDFFTRVIDPTLYADYLDSASFLGDSMQEV